MAEYINREKAIAYVEEQYRLFRNDEAKQSVVEGCVESLKFVPAADVVEVVRCCECKSAFHDKETNLFWCARMNGKSVERNHFCSYGEPKECEG